MKLPTIFRKLSETRKVVKDARSLCRNDVADLKGHGFEPHLRPGKLFACKNFFPLKKLNPNLLRYVLCTPSAIRDACKIPKNYSDWSYYITSHIALVEHRNCISKHRTWVKARNGWVNLENEKQNTSAIFCSISLFRLTNGCCTIALRARWLTRIIE